MRKDAQQTDHGDEISPDHIQRPAAHAPGFLGKHQLDVLLTTPEQDEFFSSKFALKSQFSVKTIEND